MMLASFGLHVLIFSFILMTVFLLVNSQDDDFENKSIYDFTVKDINGREVSLQEYISAKAILIVNVASDCGYTYVNYEELVDMYDRLHPSGLEILAFPSNQFGSQEPGSDSDIQAFTASFGVSFPMFSKVNVRGPDAISLFKFLKMHTDGAEIGWNFHKYLVVNGYPVSRYASKVPPRKIEADILPFLTRRDARLQDDLEESVNEL